MNIEEHKPGDVFVSSILGKEIETVEWTEQKDGQRCHNCALHYNCKIKENIAGRRKDVGHCGKQSRSTGMSVYFKLTKKSKAREVGEKIRQRNTGDRFFSKILGGVLEVRGFTGSGRCTCCVYNRFCGPRTTTILFKLRNLESGVCSHHFRTDNKSVYFDLVEEKYNVEEDIYKLLVELEYDEGLDPEERLWYQQTLLNATYVKNNGN